MPSPISSLAVLFLFVIFPYVYSQDSFSALEMEVSHFSEIIVTFNILYLCTGSAVVWYCN
jgi:hypothetical protein